MPTIKPNFFQKGIVEFNSDATTPNTITINESVIQAKTLLNTLTLNDVGYEINEVSSSWVDTHTTVFNTRALRTPPLSNPQILAVEKAVLVLNDNITPTASIGIEADKSGDIGTYFGMNLYNDNDKDFTITSTFPYNGSVVFNEEGGSNTTTTSIKQGLINLTDASTPFTTTFTPTKLTSGTSSMTWVDVIAGSGSVGTLNAVLTNGNVATGSSASITLQDDTDSLNMTKAGLTTTTDLTLDIGNDLIFNGDNILDTTAGGFTSNYLKIKINGQYYKLQLLSE
jgi:hypothetical protein